MRFAKIHGNYLQLHIHLLQICNNIPSSSRNCNIRNTNVSIKYQKMGCCVLQFVQNCYYTTSPHCSKLKKIYYLFSLCSPRLILTRSLQISGPYKSEAREPEGLVKITYGIVASFLFKRAGNSN